MVSIDFNKTEKYERGNALVSWQRVRFPKVAGDIAFYFSASPQNESSSHGETGGATIGCLLAQRIRLSRHCTDARL